MLVSNRSRVDDLLAAIVENATECLRERVLLQSLDWTQIHPDAVAEMLQGLGAEGVNLPTWLAKSLLVAGHVLPPAQQERLDGPLRALNAINGLASNNGQLSSTDGSGPSIDQLIVDEELEPSMLAAAARRLKTLNQGALAARLALAHWRRAPQVLRTVASDFEVLRAALPGVAVRITGTSTTHALAAEAVPAFAAVGFNASVAESGFGQVLQELLAPDEQRRDALIVLLDLDGLHAPEWRTEGAAARKLLHAKAGALVDALETYAQSGRGPILVNTLPPAVAPAVGFVDAQHPTGVSSAIHHINGRLIEVAGRNNQIILIDAHGALVSIEPRKWADPKLWYYGRVPYSADATRCLAIGFASAYRALTVGTAKVLALDLDNTLWGGIFGEDGLAKLNCDDEFPGNAFKAFQRECLRLKSQGILLAILSKNNADAITAFSEHPGMLLKEDDFVAARINWEPKASNIHELAQELNLSLDSFVFIDDSPHEREAMRRMCPEVIVPELPKDPAARPQWLRALSVTWPLRLTAEDARRSDMYLAEKRRTGLREKAGSFNDYLRSLEQTLVIGHADAATLGRIAQMHLRTNQFNLTTARYDEAAISAMMKDEQRFVVLQARALDKFGNHGLVICATAEINGEVATIKSLLMSCRVVGRGIETAFLAELLKTLQARQATCAEGAYIPTKKNALVRDFYRNSGFDLLRTVGTTEVWGWHGGSHKLPHCEAMTVQWGA
jgi:FkbH-like protein